VIGILLACTGAASPGPSPSAEPLPTDYHRAAEAAALARVPDPTRGGPIIQAISAPLPPFTGVDRAHAVYVGSETCRTCHPGPAAVWSKSAHAHALQTLQASQKAFDPGCLRCHTVGFGHPGGFGPDRTQLGLAAVGCESCHGPASHHVGQPAAGYGQLPPGPEACVACHTHDNSPEFRWPVWWQAIAHGT
jgi:hypothetical protein